MGETAVKRVLVASRGALAIRVIDVCRRLALFPVAVAAASDPQRLHLDGAEACVELGGSDPDQTYDSAASIADAAAQTGAELVYPGCGALAEDPELAARLAPLGIGFVGPPATALALATDKSAAVAAAERLGIPVLPHATGAAGITSLGAEVGLPLILKPLQGCLGEGVRIVASPAELHAALAEEGDGTGWYAEPYLYPSRIVGITLAADAAGTIVELGERETLLLRGSLKLIDASPVVTLPPEVVSALRGHARRLVAGLGLTNVVTVEFIIGPEGHFFLEVNPRLAGGYRMCEAQTGLDLVALQLDVALGRHLDPAAVPLDRGVHCLEARVYLLPEPGRSEVLPRSVERLHLAPMPHVSYDCAVDTSRPVAFGTLVAQVLATGESRQVAAARLLSAHAAAEVGGLPHSWDAIAEWVRGTGAARGPSSPARTDSSSGGSDGFSAVRFAVGPELARAVATAAGSTGGPPAALHELEELVRALARRHLAARPGYFVLTGLDRLAEPEARRFALSASRLLGRLLPQDRSGQLLRDVMDRGVRLEEAAGARYSDTRQGGSLHTDGMHRPGKVPDFVALYCVRQAALGGALVLVHVEDLLAELRRWPEVVGALRRPVHFDTREVGAAPAGATVRRPVLELVDGAERIHYLREYIESGHRHDGVPPLTREQIAALDVLDSLLDRPELQRRGRLGPGEMVFINNRSIIHGRTAFEDRSGPAHGRLLLRSWISEPPTSSGGGSTARSSPAVETSRGGHP